MGTNGQSRNGSASRDSIVPFGEQAENTLKTNYFSLVRICDALFPLLRNNARVVNVSSSAGHLSRIPDDNLKKKISSTTLTVSELSDLMNQFVKVAKENNKTELVKWGQSAYRVSKVGVTALTKIQQRQFEAETPNRNISVNAVHPGYVDTDLTNHKGPLTIEEGARAPLYLSLANHNLKGEYVWCDSIVADWKASDSPTKDCRNLPPPKY